MSTVQPELLQLSAGRPGPPPSLYIQPPPNRPSNLRPATVPVPTIDIGLVLDSPYETAKLDSALRTCGFFHAVNHGIPTPLLDRLLSATREFFSNPPAQQDGGLYGEGYGVDAVTREDQLLDWSHRLLLMVQPEQERTKMMHLWPPILKDVLLEYNERCNWAAERVLMAMEEALGLGGKYFMERCGKEAMVHKRFNHYPRCERPDLVVGLKPHKDTSAITLLLQDPEVDGGLQVLDGGGEWMGVPVVPGALLVNIGDQIEIMSNGIYKSPMHRVVTCVEKERVSVASFYHMGMEKIGPAQALMGEGRPRMYKDIILKEYHEAFFRSIPMGKNVIDTVKIAWSLCFLLLLLPLCCNMSNF